MPFLSRKLPVEKISGSLVVNTSCTKLTLSDTVATAYNSLCMRFLACIQHASKYTFQTVIAITVCFMNARFIESCTND